jgi:hypothetical protein
MEDCLPENFADRLIELESMLDEQYSMELIQQLNELYRVIKYFIFRLLSITMSDNNLARQSISKRK